MLGHQVGRSSSSSVTVSTVVFLLGILLLIEAGDAQANNQRCNPDRIQTCQVPLTKLMEKRQVFATNKEELVEACGVLKPVVRCLQGMLEECTQMGTMRLDQFFSGFISTLNDLCDVNSQFSKDYLKHAPCMSEVDARVTTCARAQSSNRPASSDDSNLIEVLCCSVKSAVTCTKEVYNEHCGAEASQLGYQMMKTMLGPMVQNTCVDSHGNFKCSGCNSLSTSVVTSLLSLATLFLILKRIDHV